MSVLHYIQISIPSKTFRLVSNDSLKVTWTKNSVSHSRNFFVVDFREKPAMSASTAQFGASLKIYLRKNNEWGDWMPFKIEFWDRQQMVQLGHMGTTFCSSPSHFIMSFNIWFNVHMTIPKNSLPFAVFSILIEDFLTLHSVSYFPF